MDGYLERFVRNVWPKVKGVVSNHGGQRYDGYVGPGKGWGWHGPFIWSEDGDLKRIITKFCEDEFGFLNVHNESKISQMAFDEQVFGTIVKNGSTGRYKSIDIDVTNASESKTATTFRTTPHGLFIEVKMFQKGSNASDEAIGKYLRDGEKLLEEVTAGRCQAGVAILVDEGDLNGKSYVAAWEERTQRRLDVEFAKYEPVVPLCWRIGD